MALVVSVQDDKNLFGGIGTKYLCYLVSGDGVSEELFDHGIEAGFGVIHEIGDIFDLKEKEVFELWPEFSFRPFPAHLLGS